MGLLARTRPGDRSPRSLHRLLVQASVALALTSAPPLAVLAASGQQTPAAAPQTSNERYRDGIVIWETPADAKVPFLLKFNINTQLRYHNTQDTTHTFPETFSITRVI